MLDPMPRQDVKLPPTQREAELMAEIKRLRGLLQAIELATATGDGLSPDETINIHALAAQHSESGEQPDG